MLLKLFPLFLTILEVITLVVSTKLIGFWATLLFIIMGFVLGGWLLRRQGLATAERFVTKLQGGEAPLAETWDAACLVVAAILFILPGFLSDLLALLLLLPLVRAGLRKVIFRTRFAEQHYWFKGAKARRVGTVTIIEGSSEEVR